VSGLKRQIQKNSRNWEIGWNETALGADLKFDRKRHVCGTSGSIADGRVWCAETTWMSCRRPRPSSNRVTLCGRAGTVPITDHRRCSCIDRHDHWTLCWLVSTAPPANQHSPQPIFVEGRGLGDMITIIISFPPLTTFPPNSVLSSSFFVLRRASVPLSGRRKERGSEVERKW